MQIEMEPDDTVTALWRTCDSWAMRASEFERLADSDFPDGSRLHVDAGAATVGDASIAVSNYVRERLWNAARMLRALHRQVFATEPGRFHLDSTVMYPLMRAAMEDATTISWLQTPGDRNERLTRSFRALYTDSVYFTTNHSLLAAAAPEVPGVPRELGDALAAHMAAEMAESKAHFERMAGELGLDVAESTRSLTTSAPFKAQYGDRSLQFVTWKFLSDLSHYSFMMLRHLNTSPIPGSDVPLLHATMLHLAGTVNRVCDDAIALVQRAASQM